MAQFSYTAKTAAGQDVKGFLQAADRNQLIQLLRQKNLTPISMTEVAVKKPKSKSGGMFSKKIPLGEIVIFSRQLATMIDSGIPVLQALEIVSEQTDNKAFREILTDIAKRVASGSSIFKAMNHHTKIFSEFFVHIVKAGEESGNLDEILDRVAIYMEKTDKLIRKVKGAMIYPSIVISMAIGITALMIVKVIPVFVDMYEGFDIDLPTPTKFLIATSEFAQAYISWIMIGIGVFVWLLRQYNKTASGRMLFDSIKLRLPVFGDLIRKVAVSKFSRTLGTLLKSGVPILRAMDIVAKTSGNKVVEKAVIESTKSIREGRNIADPLRESKVFPPMVTRMISVGESSGELEVMLNKISDFYDDQVDVAVAGLTSMIEPLVIAFLGIVIGGIVISMFLPMFQMVNMVT